MDISVKQGKREVGMKKLGRQQVQLLSTKSYPGGVDIRGSGSHM